MNLYIVPGKTGGDEIYYLLAETGEALYSHWCSLPGYAPGDLLQQRPERIKEIKEKYPEGYKLMFIDDDDATITYKELVKRNHALKDEAFKSKADGTVAA